MLLLASVQRRTGKRKLTHARRAPRTTIPMLFDLCTLSAELFRFLRD